MTAPEYEIVATVTEGACLTPTLTFAAGVPGEPVGIGRAAQWAVAAEGVAPVHVYVAFDGQNLFAAAAVPGAPVTLAGRPLGAEWTHVALPSELRFGAASIAVVRKVSSRAPVPRGGARAELGWGGESTVHDGGALYAAAQKAMGPAARTVASAPAAGRPLDASAANALRGGGSQPPPAAVQPVFAPYASEPMRIAAPAPPFVHADAAASPVGAPPAQPPIAAPPTPAAPSAVAAFWTSASPVKKLTLLLFPVVLVMTFLALKQDDDRQAFEADQAALALRARIAGAAASASSSSAAAPAAVPPRPPQPTVAAADAGARWAAGSDPDDDEDADLEPAPSVDAGASAKAKSARSKAAERRERERERKEAKNRRTPERLALDAVAAGSYAEAAKLYDGLAASHPGDPTYREASRILRERMRVGD